MNKHGKLILKDPFDAVGTYSDQRAIAVREGKYGYLNEQGQIEIPLQFSLQSETFSQAMFKNETAIVQLKNKKGIIDKTGQKIVPFIYDDIGSYDTLLMPVKKENKWGYADKNNKVKIGYQFDYASSFNNNMSWVNKGNKLYLMNAKGKLYQMDFDKIVSFMHDLFIVEKKNKKGIVDTTGKIIIDPLYDSIEMIHEFFLSLINETTEYYSIKTNQKIHP